MGVVPIRPLPQGGQPLVMGLYPTDRKHRYRFYDGDKWIRGTIKVKKTNHLAHGIATVLTCGVWAPFWWVATISKDKDGFPTNYAGGYAP